MATRARKKAILIINPNRRKNATRPEFQQVTRRVRERGFEVVELFVDEEVTTKGLPVPFFFSGLYDGIIALGSEYDFHSELAPWNDKFVEFMARLINHDIPILGICYSMYAALLISRGAVLRLPKREVGYVESHLTPDGIRVRDDSGITARLPDTFTLGQNRQFYVADVPDDFMVLAENDTGPQVFMHRRKPHFYITGHPEQTDSWVADRTQRYRAEIGDYDGPITSNTNSLMFDNFLGLVRGT